MAEEDTNQDPPKPVEPHHSPQKTTHRKHPYYKHHYLLTFCTVLTIFLLLAGLTLLILYLIYRPHTPQFTVTSAAVYQLNTASPPLISTSMQFTIITRNPNKRVSILYDKLTAYVSYKNHDITPRVVLPPLHHDTKTTVAFSPVLGGADVPVAVEVSNGLVMDEAYGVVELTFVLVGRLRWKAGGVKTGRYGVHVKCDVWVGLKRGLGGQVPLLRSPQCKVDV